MQYIETDPTETYVTSCGRVTVAADLHGDAILVPDELDGHALLRMYRPQALRPTPDLPLAERRTLADWADLADWVARPLCPVPEHLVGAPYSTVMAQCPEGCWAEVIDEIGEEVIGRVQEDAGLIAISLPDPGAYRIEVNAPLPYLSRVVSVRSETGS
jgi:hypothetical protein